MVRHPPQLPSQTRRAIGRSIRAVAATAGFLALGCLLGGCDIIGDYPNLRNSFLNPAEVGRFDKARPFGEVKPVKWPILESIDLVDEPSTRWANATDPTPADLLPEVHEYAFSPGDAIAIEIFEMMVPGQAYTKQSRINELGLVTIQNLGSIKVVGLTPTQVEQKISQLVIERGILPPPGQGQPGPQVSVTLLESRQRVFSILGSVARPGTYNVLSPDFRLLDALALAGDVPVQPGMDYLYIIRQLPPKNPEAATELAPPGLGPIAPPPTMPGGLSPEDILKGIEKGTSLPGTAPATEPTMPATAPGTGPGAMGPRVRPMATATVMGKGVGIGPTVAQFDLDAALGGLTKTPATTPATTQEQTQPATTTAPATAAATTASTNPEADLLGQAASQPAGAAPQYVYIDGKWVPIAATAPATGPATTVATTEVGPATTRGTGVAAVGTGPATTEEMRVEGLEQQRVIRIPINQLREGVSKYNIIIRPGDVMNIPSVEPGEFYMMGNISRPGVYSLTGRKITLKQAVAAAGNLGALAIPRRCDLIRRIGNDQEAIVQVNLQKIFDGTQPDIFLKSYDVVNVGTDAFAPFLAVTRNAYRASYGWGFVYDKNLNTSNNTSNSSSSSSGG